MAWLGTGITDRGRVRRSNQDAFAVINDRRLWLVADGMGGRAGGDVASRMAVETLVHAFTHNHGTTDAWAPLRDDPASAIRRAITLSNQAIRNEALKRPELIGMGTTVVIAMMDQNASRMTIAHVGDSRAYLLRKQTLTRLTRDHSLVEHALSIGELSQDEAEQHPLRHVLTRAVGTEPDADPDIAVHALQSDDLILLCTDGLTKMLTDDRILAMLLRTKASSESACTELVREANRLGGDDNVSIVIVRKTLTN